MSAEQREVVAQRLEDLAAAQDLGDPAAAAALRGAAEAVRAGATGQAKAALGEAGQAHDARDRPASPRRRQPPTRPAGSAP